MDLALFTRNRLKQLRLGPRDLARATRMTESYVAHVLAANSSQTAWSRTDMQDQLESVLNCHKDNSLSSQICSAANTSTSGWEINRVPYSIAAQDHLVSFDLLLRGSSGFP